MQKGGALLSSGWERKAEGVRKKRKYKTTPFSVNLMRSQTLYWAAQAQGGGHWQKILLKAQLLHYATSAALGCLSSAEETYELALGFKSRFWCTGSGKTYTMEGPPGDRGVNYRTLQQLFNTVEARRDETSFIISVSLLEVPHSRCTCKAECEHYPNVCLFTHFKSGNQQACS